MLGVEPDHDYAVLEFGASRRGEIAALADLCRPKVGVITRIGEAHLAEFGSRQAIAASQGRAARRPAAARPGRAGRRAAAPHAGPSVVRAGITWIGDGPRLRPAAHGGRKAAAAAGVSRWPIAGSAIPGLGTPSPHRGAGRDRGRPDDGNGLRRDGRGLAQAYESVPMRCQVQAIRGATIINDAYNSNPTAMRAALELLGEFRRPRPADRRLRRHGRIGQRNGNIALAAGQQTVTSGRAELLIACGEFAAARWLRPAAVGLPRPDDRLWQRRGSLALPGPGDPAGRRGAD